MINSTLLRFTAALAVGIGALGCSLLAASTAEATNTPTSTLTNANDVIARGKGFEVKRSRLDDAVNMMRSRHPGEWESFSKEEKDQVQAIQLDTLVTEALLLSRATEADKAKGVTNADENIAMIKVKTPAEELTQMLKQLDLSEAQWHARMVEVATCDAVVDREVASKVVVPDEEIRKAYEEDPELIDSPETVHVAHVLLSTKDTNGPAAELGERKDIPEAKKQEKKKLAETIRDRAKKGEDFAKLAKEFSEDPGSRDNGGEYTFPRGQMLPEFEDASFALGSNEVSEVITTDMGYHVIKGLGKTAAKRKPFDEVKNEIKDSLTEDAVSKKMPAYLDNLKKEANVEILDESLKLKPEPEPETGTNAPALTLPIIK